MSSIPSVHQSSLFPALRSRCLGPRQVRPITVVGAASVGVKAGGPRVGIKDDATQLVGSTPMVGFLMATL